jgi:GH24 family phage-related lysozyme (muramidase)
MSKLKGNALATKAAPMIPVSLNFSMDGMSGFGMGQSFTVDPEFLPYSYNLPNEGNDRTVAFVMIGLDHTIEANQWISNVRTNMIYGKKGADFEKDKVKKLSAGQALRGATSTDSLIFDGGPGSGPVNLGPLDFSADWITLAAKFIAKNEGFTERATWDVNAYRLGYGTDKIVGSDGQIRDVLPSPSYYKQTRTKVPPNPPGDTTTIEAAFKMLQYEVSTSFKNRLVGKAAYQIPQETFDALNNKQKAALISYVYNVGSLRVGIATAIKNLNLSSAAAQIQAGPITGDGIVISGLVRRRKEEAALFSMA